MPFDRFADSLRDEVNALGIRVLSVYPGRTATPRIAKLFEKEGRTYQPDLLMQPEDVAEMVTHSLRLPRTAEVTDISILADARVLLTKDASAKRISCKYSDERAPSTTSPTCAFAQLHTEH
jgi:short-subunit dehydrogenase